MTNIQIIMAIFGAAAFPTVTALIGILLNTRGLDKVEVRLDRIEADLRQFYSVTGKLDGRMDAIERMK